MCGSPFAINLCQTPCHPEKMCYSKEERYSAGKRIVYDIYFLQAENTKRAEEKC